MAAIHLNDPYVPNHTWCGHVLNGYTNRGARKASRTVTENPLDVTCKRCAPGARRRLAAARGR